MEKNKNNMYSNIKKQNERIMEPGKKKLFTGTLK